MAEARPVFVIHGVNVRGEAEFGKLVQQFNGLVGNAWRFIPIYWGDLGGNDKGIEATIPRSKVDQDGLDAAALLAGSGTRADIADIAAAAAASRVAASPSTRAGTEDIYAAVREEWRQADTLRLIQDPALAAEIGEAIGEAIASAEDGTMGVRSDTRGIASGVVNAFNRVVRAIIARVLKRLNESLRLQFGPTLARFLGDVFVYRETKTAIEKRVVDALTKEGAGTAANPATVLGHSYGGVIAFTMATRKDNPIHMRRFVTFGSQSAFFHVIQPIGLVPEFLGKPVPVPATIGSWLNVWEPLDPLAFLAQKVFVLASGGSLEDRALPHDPDGGFWTHSAYWLDKRFASWVAKFI